MFVFGGFNSNEQCHFNDFHQFDPGGNEFD